MSAAPLRLDHLNLCLWRGDVRIDLPVNAFRILTYLVERPHQLVTKDELLDAVWPDTHVVDAILSVTVSQLRDALGDDPRRPRYVETLHRRGYRWIGTLAPERAGAAPADGRAPAALVGRDAALAELEAAAARAASGRRQVVFVTGEPGIGKTALIDHFLASPAAGRALVARGQCIDAYGAGEAYMPLLEALQQMVRGTGDALDVLRSRAPTWLLQLPGLLAPAEHDTLSRSLASSTAARMVRELQQMLEAMAAERTVILVLEDLHWSDPPTVAALAALAMRREPAKLLVIGSYRPVDAVAELHPIAVLKHELTAKRQCLELALDGIAVDAVADYLAARFAHHVFPGEVAARLHRQTAGNPLFLLNAVEDLEQRRWLTDDDGVWRCTVDPAELDAAVPETTRAMIDARLIALPAPVLAMLEAASVIGPTFASQTLAAALERDAADVEHDCTALARAGRFVKELDAAHWPDGTSGAQYAFRHALYQQVLYGRVTAARRQALDRAVAARLEHGYGDDAREIAGVLAVHWERGGDLLRAVTHHARAAEVARARYSFEQAVGQYRHAIALLLRLPPGAERDAREIGLQSELVSCVFSTEGPGAAELEAIAARIETLSSTGVTTPGLLTSLFGLIALCITRGDLDRAEALCERALARASEVADAAELFTNVARGLFGLTQHRRGRFAAAIPHLTAGAALPLLGAVAMNEPSTVYACELGFSRFLMGELRHGLETMQAADAQAAASGHAPTIVFTASHVMRLGQMLGDRALVARVAATMGDLAERLASPRFSAYRQSCLGWLGMDAGEPDGVATYREGCRILAADSHLVFAPFTYGLTAVGSARLGRLDEARNVLAEAFGWLKSTGARWCEPELHRVRGEIAAATAATLRARSKGREQATREAEACFRRAIALARAQGGRWWELRALVDLARVRPPAERDGETMRELRALHAALDDGIDAPALAAVRAFLETARS